MHVLIKATKELLCSYVEFSCIALKIYFLKNKLLFLFYILSCWIYFGGSGLSLEERDFILYLPI